MRRYKHALLPPLLQHYPSRYYQDFLDLKINTSFLGVCLSSIIQEMGLTWYLYVAYSHRLFVCVTIFPFETNINVLSIAKWNNLQKPS